MITDTVQMTRLEAATATDKCRHCGAAYPLREKISSRLCKLCRKKERHERYVKRREIEIADSRAWQINNPGRAYLTKRQHKLAKLGMTTELYDVMHESQGGLCAICKNPETQRRKGKVYRLATDHNHKTGFIRELLCSRCNKLIGAADENADILRAAADYIEKHAVIYAATLSQPLADPRMPLQLQHYLLDRQAELHKAQTPRGIARR